MAIPLVMSSDDALSDLLSMPSQVAYQSSRSSPIATRRRVRLGPPPSQNLADAVTVRLGEKPKREKKPPRMKAKNDPVLVAKVRELNARWMEQVNENLAAELGVGEREAITLALEVRADVLLIDERAGR